MIIQISVENFKSFDNKIFLNMLPCNKARMKPEHKIDITKGTSLLKYSIIYGANAAGKSNLIDIFRFIQYCVHSAIPTEALTLFCKNKKENISRPSTFELQFTVNGRFYTYGFSLLLSQRAICSEWLYEFYQNGSSKMLFQWENGKKPELGESIALGCQDKSKLITYLDDFEENSNQLFLSYMNRWKKYGCESKLTFFKETYDWIVKGLTICEQKDSISCFEYYYGETSLPRINEIIKMFDTGISEIRMDEISIDELCKELSAPVFESVMNEIKKRAEDKSLAEFCVSMRSDHSFFNIHYKKNQEPKISTIHLKHGQSFYDFKFKEESDGTKRIFELLDILLNKATDKVYIIDEIERSLHPKLTSKFIELFDALHLNQKIQLIFTTHESSIMDQELFRRDEVWFVERDKENNSTLYSLDKFKERYDKKLSKCYLEGRYGAIPVFSSFCLGENKQIAGEEEQTWEK